LKDDLDIYPVKDVNLLRSEQSMTDETLSPTPYTQEQSTEDIPSMTFDDVYHVSTMDDGSATHMTREQQLKKLHKINSSDLGVIPSIAWTQTPKASRPEGRNPACLHDGRQVTVISHPLDDVTRTLLSHV